MKNPIIAGSAAIDLITDNGTATFRGHSDHPGIAGWIRETEIVLASVFDFPKMMWMDLKSIESNIRFQLRLAETKSQKEKNALPRRAVKPGPSGRGYKAQSC